MTSEPDNPLLGKLNSGHIPTISMEITKPRFRQDQGGLEVPEKEAAFNLLAEAKTSGLGFDQRVIYGKITLYFPDIRSSQES